MRRTLGAVLIVIGAAILCGVAVRYARGAYDRDRARSEWAALEAHRAVAAASTVASAPTHTTYAPGVLVGQLLIPKVRLTR